MLMLMHAFAGDAADAGDAVDAADAADADADAGKACMHT